MTGTDLDHKFKVLESRLERRILELQISLFKMTVVSAVLVVIWVSTIIAVAK